MEAQGPPPQQQPPPQPGWYPNPQGPGQRYWDGTQWTGSYQAQKEDHTTRNVLIAVGAVVAVLLVLVVGSCAACGALTIGLGTEAVNELEREQNRHAITETEYRSLEIGGVSKREVIRRFGRPESTEYRAPRERGSDCISYNQKDGALFGSYELCFDERGELRDKSEL